MCFVSQHHNVTLQQRDQWPLPAQKMITLASSSNMRKMCFHCKQNSAVAQVERRDAIKCNMFNRWHYYVMCSKQTFVQHGVARV